MSKKELDRLGDRLRDAPVPSEEDLHLWGMVRPHFLASLQHVQAQLRERLGLQPTVREKNRETLVDKLRRERDMRLSRVQDVVGARIVREMTLSEQDDLVRRIGELFPDHRVRDRRREPSHGYRAVHLVARIDGLAVEIQIRTQWQDRWAQAMEHLGDCWGRAIRYGGEPEDAGREERMSLPGLQPRSRQDWTSLLIALQQDVAQAEESAGTDPVKRLLEPERLAVRLDTLLLAFEHFRR
ncbi:MAG TPA: hypothetical protein VFY71_11180 [Planctomycetota bacterium]|nr:hypothetical protein [Planctomycetota bacterium]